jgi:transposase InsO family protein
LARAKRLPRSVLGLISEGGMREQGLRAKGAHKHKATTDSKHKLPIAPNLLERRFDVDRPNAAWVSDITHLWTRRAGCISPSS